MVLPLVVKPMLGGEIIGAAEVTSSSYGLACFMHAIHWYGTYLYYAYGLCECLVVDSKEEAVFVSCRSSQAMSPLPRNILVHQVTVFYHPTTLMTFW